MYMTLNMTVHVYQRLYCTCVSETLLYMYIRDFTVHVYQRLYCTCISGTLLYMYIRDFTVHVHASGDEASSMHMTYIQVIDNYPPHHSHCNVYFRKYIRDGSKISLRGGVAPLPSIGSYTIPTRLV